ncbi:protein-glutamate O-methyltransferase CheR [Clostridiaceae bacterium HSG29]|nr:protein-glutamate O-methyltransferase CheR [Clostridiaceae bacterium HSG29]
MTENELLKIEEIELKLFLQAIYLKYGYDFDNYTKKHIKRRIKRRMQLDNFSSISKITEKLLYSEEYFRKIILKDLSINTTEMFRYPEFFKMIREDIIPILRTYPSINIWHAGASTGEEIFSMAILLKEEGLLEKTNIYATDFNLNVLNSAKKGIYSMEKVKKWTKNYQEAGGKKSFAEYYIAKYDSVIFDSALLKNVTFLEHNLVEDGSFIEANLIICRNVFIYFNNQLQERILKLFLDSLTRGGFLGLGSKESIKYNESKEKFNEISFKNKIYQKKYLE